jgi:hypothetical protein
MATVRHISGSRVVHASGVLVRRGDRQVRVYLAVEVRPHLHCRRGRPELSAPYADASGSPLTTTAAIAMKHNPIRFNDASCRIVAAPA